VRVELVLWTLTERTLHPRRRKRRLSGSVGSESVRSGANWSGGNLGVRRLAGTGRIPLSGRRIGGRQGDGRPSARIVGIVVRGGRTKRIAPRRIAGPWIAIAGISSKGPRHPGIPRLRKTLRRNRAVAG